MNEKKREKRSSYLMFQWGVLFHGISKVRLSSTGPSSWKWMAYVLGPIHSYCSLCLFFSSYAVYDPVYLWGVSPGLPQLIASHIEYWPLSGPATRVLPSSLTYWRGPLGLVIYLLHVDHLLNCFCLKLAASIESPFLCLWMTIRYHLLSKTWGCLQ